MPPRPSILASPLLQARRVVVKVGSALLVDQDTGRLNRTWLETLIEDLLRMRKRGQQVILVSSGAIALGRRQLGLAKGGLRLDESQAAAAVGQIRLAHAYKELLEASDVTVAQVLLTLEDSERRSRYLNARATLESLLALGALPVINENDTVATAEIRYGDNDRLAARVAQMAGADCLVIANTFLSLKIRTDNFRPALGNKFGGLVSPALKPIVLRMVYQVAKQVKIPIIGIGGVTKAEDVVEYMLAGASAVGIGYAGFRNPTALITIIDDLEAWCDERGIKKVTELIGAVKDADMETDTLVAASAGV